MDDSTNDNFFLQVGNWQRICFILYLDPNKKNYYFLRALNRYHKDRYCDMVLGGIY